MKHLIVGSGIAALAAIEELRQHDRQSSITVVSAEPHPFIYRPMIPFLVAGTKTIDDLAVTSPVDRFGVELITGEAVALDGQARTLTLAAPAPSLAPAALPPSGRSADGCQLPYDKLLIAAGASPVLPPIAGMEAGAVHVIRTAADALRLRQALRAGGKAVVIGAGLVGIKIACALKEAGQQVTVVEKMEQILFPRCDRRGAGIIAKALADSGIAVETGVDIVEILPGGTGIRLASDQVITAGRSGAIPGACDMTSIRSADVVVVAVGIRANTAWLVGSGLEIGRGIRVDGSCATAIPSVFAAGDVAELPDPVTGRSFVSGLWANAFAMGRTAGAVMSGTKRRLPACLENALATEIAGIPLAAVGEIGENAGDGEVRRETEAGYCRAVFQGDRLVGAVFSGREIDKAGLYSNLIRNRRPIAPIRSKLEAFSVTAADVIR